MRSRGTAPALGMFFVRAPGAFDAPAGAAVIEAERQGCHGAVLEFITGGAS